MATLFIFIVVLGVLILVHEFGHFYVAKKLGIKVEQFGFGFPPRLFGKKFRGTLYSFNLFPLGGFVKIFGEHGEGEGIKESFISRPGWQKFLVIFAGVFMNLMLAWAFFSFGNMLGVPAVKESAGDEVKNAAVTIVGVARDSPAGKSGIHFGDAVLEMRAVDFFQKINSVEDLQKFVAAYKGEKISLVLKRGDSLVTVEAVPRIEYPEGEGALGIALAEVGTKIVPLYLAPVEGLKSVYFTTVGTISAVGSLFKNLILSGRVPSEISGPVGIFLFVGEVKSLGLVYLLQFIAILSVNLAVLNILPIPALDGGRILFLAIERVIQSKFNPKVENAIHTAGFLILILLMIIITYRDIIKLF